MTKYTIDYCFKNHIAIIGNPKIIWDSKKFNPNWTGEVNNGKDIIILNTGNWGWMPIEKNSNYNYGLEYFKKNYTVNKVIDLEELEEFKKEQIDEDFTRLKELLYPIY